jgi:hypothetical protein
VAINIVGVSGKNFSSLGKIVVCPEKFFGMKWWAFDSTYNEDGVLTRTKKLLVHLT